ncbi:MAG TPA: UDP-glucose 4-epimerase GalE [Candidatus Paceibacterota bacterium]
MNNGSKNSKGKILVTGGAGFIGSHTAVALVEAGYEPVIIDNLSNSESGVLEALGNITGWNLSFYEADCRNKTALDTLAEKEGAFVGVMHFAAYKSVGESVKEPLKYYENNIGSLTALLDFADRHSIPNFIFSSSCTVYGEPDDLPVTEDHPMKPAESPYGNTKQIGENIVRDFVAAKKNIKAVNLRYFNPIGAHPSGLIGELPKGVPENLLPYLTQVAYGQREHLTIFGNDYDTRDGTCMRDYIHVMDIARAHVDALAWLESRSEPSINEVFNVGIGTGTTVLELIQAFEEATGVSVKYVIGERRSGDIEKVYADPKKIKETIGWEPRHTITDALRDSWNWQKNLRA